MNKFLFTCLIFAFSTAALHCQTLDPMSRWSLEIHAHNLQQIIVTMQEDHSMPWPRLITNTDSTLKSGSTTPSDLGLALLEKIRLFEKSTAYTKIDTEKAIEVYGTLSSILQKSGGYINTCLTDAVNRLALERIAALLIRHKAPVSEVKANFETVKSFGFSSQDFVAIANEEKSTRGNTNLILVQMPPEDAKKQIFAILGTTESEVMSHFAMGSGGTSNLIEKPNLAMLLERIGQTETVAQVAMAALIDFLEHGGQYSDIRMDDIRPFRTIMNGREQLFKSRLMNISATNVGFIFNIMKMLDANGPANNFVNIALQ